LPKESGRKYWGSFVSNSACIVRENEFAVSSVRYPTVAFNSGVARISKGPTEPAQQLLDEVRFEAPCQLLDTARIPITEIAVSLGYAEASAFTRAFRRWSGTTPVERRLGSQNGLRQ
jgi:AraC-like DNA-binding protein